MRYWLHRGPTAAWSQRWRRWLAGVLLALVPVAALADSAVILLYHHVSEKTPAATSVSPALFAQHMAAIKAGGYQVLPLTHILQQLQSGAGLPEKTVAITFDDAYLSIYTTAWPLLRKHKWPFTVFVNSDAVDAGYIGQLSWQQLRHMREQGVEMGNHSATHAHLVRRRSGESEPQWRRRVRVDIERAGTRLRQELGTVSKLFAYPYGEYDEAVQALVKELGLIGVAQQSGAVGSGYNPLIVPRFPMVGKYVTVERLQTSLNTRPLPVGAVAAGPIVQRQGHTVASVEFSLAEGDYRRAAVACYTSTGERLPLLAPAQASGRYQLQMPAMRAGRNKINCTAAHVSKPDTFYWYSHQWLVLAPDGSWYEEGEW